jgi:SpoVK/Ycf46/Vps4 family AAA+-type ATPase
MQVILDATKKEDLMKDVHDFFDNQQLYTDYAVPWKRGIILYGSPGNGKTVTITSLMKSLRDRVDQISSLYVGSLVPRPNNPPESSILRVFQKARQIAPCFLVLEDLDGLVKEETRSYFLNELDGLESNDGIFIIASANDLNKLHPAISKRPSRFDRRYHFALPDEECRTAYAMVWREKVLHNKSIDFPEELGVRVGKLTEGFSYAYLRSSLSRRSRKCLEDELPKP